MEIGRRIYFDKATGNVLVDTGERAGDVIKMTVEQDMEVYKALSERNRDLFDFIELEYGQNLQDFMECNNYRVNTTTKVIEFSYTGSNQSEKPPVYQKPLSEQIKELKLRQESTEEAISFLLGL